MLKAQGSRFLEGGRQNRAPDSGVSFFRDNVYTLHVPGSSIGGARAGNSGQHGQPSHARNVPGADRHDPVMCVLVRGRES